MKAVVVRHPVCSFRHERSALTLPSSTSMPVPPQQQLEFLLGSMQQPCRRETQRKIQTASEKAYRERKREQDKLAQQRRRMRLKECPHDCLSLWQAQQAKSTQATGNNTAGTVQGDLSHQQVQQSNKAAGVQGHVSHQQVQQTNDTQNEERALK